MYPIEGVIHPNLKLLSHSSDGLLNTCARRYELTKLKPAIDQDGDYHTDFGKLVGFAVQQYLVSGDVEWAKYQAFLAWTRLLDDDEGERDKKTFWHALYGLVKFTTFRDTELSRYKLAYFDGKPAIELGFSIDLGDGFFYRGFLDALLVDTIVNELAVVDTKTNKRSSVHEAMFKNSAQALGYSLVIDAVAKKLGFVFTSSYAVNYAVYKTPVYEWENMKFTKNHTQRALWLRNILISKMHISEYSRIGYFPMRGESCFSFFKVCPFFEVCEMKTEFLVGPEPVVKVDDPTKYTFHFTLQELIEAQLEKGDL